MSLLPEFTRAEALANVVSRGSGSTAKSPVQNVMVRMPLQTLATLDVMRARADKSRGAMCVHLVEVALAEVSKYIDPEDLYQIQEEADALHESWLQDLAEQASSEPEGIEPC